MKFLDIVKELLPYVVSIIASIITYIQAKKKLTQELEIVKTNNKHEIDLCVKIVKSACKSFAFTTCYTTTCYTTNYVK